MVASRILLHQLRGIRHVELDQVFVCPKLFRLIIGLFVVVKQFHRRCTREESDNWQKSKPWSFALFIRGISPRATHHRMDDRSAAFICHSLRFSPKFRSVKAVLMRPLVSQLRAEREQPVNLSFVAWANG